MYASIHKHDLTYADFFRDCAAAGAAIIAASWLGLVVSEAIRSHQWIPNISAFPQAIGLAFIFAAYAIGWRRELIGAVLAIFGTVAFFAVGYLSMGVIPPLPALWLAVPGILYLLAWYFGRHDHGNPRFSGTHPPTIGIHH
jgi:peptidoglycan/LPS O-acetylase OafA/YrhL